MCTILLHFVGEVGARPRRRVRKVENVASAVAVASRVAARNVEEELDAAATMARKVRGFKLKRSVTIASQVCSLARYFIC